MEENKKILLSGKLSGTRTFSSELEKIPEPDEIEKFLLYFSKLKIELTDIPQSNIIYINDDQELLEVHDRVLQSEYISLHTTPNFSRLYITISSLETFVIRLNKVSSAIIGLFISKEKPIKFSLNSFNFIKWCNSKSIDIKNLYDIPTYIKLLTNDIDPFKTNENYITQYTDYVFEENDNEKNNVTICNFIYKFGNILSEYIEKFELSTVSKLINENSYYEGNTFNNTGNCLINIAYTNVENSIKNILESVENKYLNKAYIISPLNRIASKFRYNAKDLIHELYTEDLSITIFYELYNNNIPVKINYSNNSYVITCKYKNFSNIITLLNAIFTETFVTIFDQSPEIHIECIIKE